MTKPKTLCYEAPNEYVEYDASKKLPLTGELIKCKTCEILVDSSFLRLQHNGFSVIFDGCKECLKESWIRKENG